MLSNEGLALLSIVCVCALVLACGSSAVASGYFPDVLSCGSWPDNLVPPPDVLAQAAPAPPTPLFDESFQGLADSVIAPKWLPDRLDDALYLEHGEGAYRAQTAHLCKIYERSGSAVVRKGFEDRLVAIVEPIPVNITREVYEALMEAAKQTDPDPCVGGTYPYKEDGAPAAVVSMFASIRDELLAPGAYPVNRENWDRRAKLIRMVRAGLELSYLAKGPMNDAAVDPAVAANASNYVVSIWTDGTTLMVALHRNNIVRSDLYRQLQPIVDISMEGLRLPYVSRIVTAGEWVVVGEAGQGDEIPEEPLVATREQASHQKLYFDLGDGSQWMGLVHNLTSATEIEEAAWLCLARSSVHGVSSWDYGYVDQQGSATEVLQRLKHRRARHQAEVNRLERAPCPQSLSDLRYAVVSAFRRSEAAWELAWPYWESALTDSSQQAVDYDALRATVRKEIESGGLVTPPFTWGAEQCWELISDAERALGMRTDEVVYEP